MAEEPERKPESERDAENEKLKKSPEYRRFKQLLKQVVKAPPLRRSPTKRTG
jgi:hypothetical protein